MLDRSLPQVAKTFENVPSGMLEHPGGNNMGLFCYLRRAGAGEGELLEHRPQEGVDALAAHALLDDLAVRTE